jgi:hypothetical protein
MDGLPSTASPSKGHPPGSGASSPQFGEGGSPFKPGRVRDDLTLRARWSSVPSAGGQGGLCRGNLEDSRP